MPPTNTQGSRKFRAPVPPRATDANNVSPRGGVPPNQVFSPGTDKFENPGDDSSFTDTNNDTRPMGTKVATTTKQPSAAGTRPMNVTASRPQPKGPGIVRSAGASVQRLPKAPGLKQNLGAVSHGRPAARGLNQTVRPARTTPRAAGIAQTITQQKTRNMRGPGANPAFYGDLG